SPAKPQSVSDALPPFSVFFPLVPLKVAIVPPSVKKESLHGRRSTTSRQTCVGTVRLSPTQPACFRPRLDSPPTSRDDLSRPEPRTHHAIDERMRPKPDPLGIAQRPWLAFESSRENEPMPRLRCPSRPGPGVRAWPRCVLRR